jgi:hypothetical protein
VLVPNTEVKKNSRDTAREVCKSLHGSSWYGSVVQIHCPAFVPYPAIMLLSFRFAALGKFARLSSFPETHLRGTAIYNGSLFDHKGNNTMGRRLVKAMKGAALTLCLEKAK